MKEIIGYKCLKCSQDKGKHKASTFECPISGRDKFKGFSTEKYIEDTTKPVYGFKL